MARCLVVGLGYIGLALANALKAEGHDVLGVCRTPKNSSVSQINCDVGDLKSTDLPKDLDTVFYLLSADSYDEAHYQKAYVDYVKHVLDCLEGRTIQRFIFVSSTGVYYQKNNETVDEQTETNAFNFSSRTLLEGERLSLNSGFPATVVRFAGLYGPKRERVLKQIKEQKAAYVEQDYFTNYLHQADAVGILIHVMSSKSSLELVNAVDNEPSTHNTILKWFAQRLNKEFALSAEQALRGGKKCSNKKLIQSGYTFQYPTFREGYEQILGCMGKYST